MVADFRRYYGIDLPIEDGGDIPDMARMAMLWASLPDGSRCVRRIVPASRWGDAEYLLRNIEYWEHVRAWQATKDGAKGRNAPAPVQSPGERARNERRRDDALAARAEIDRVLGIGESKGA